MHSITINNLPLEILIKIFQYLNYGDIEMASLVCVNWFEITKLPEFSSKFQLKLNGCYINDDYEPASVFIKSTRTYRSLYLKGCRLENCNKFLDKIGETVESVKFRLCREECFLVLNSIKKLRELTWYDFWMICDTEYFKEFDNMIANSNVLTNLNKIALEAITKVMPDSSVIMLIKNNAKTLKSFEFTFNGSSKRFWNELKDISSELNLNEFKCNDRQINKWRHPLNEYRDFVLKSNNIKIFKIYGPVEINDNDMLLITENLKNLESLRINLCVNLTNQSLMHIQKLKKLKILEISNIGGNSNTNFITNNVIAKTLIKGISKNLIELYLRHMELNDNDMIEIIENSPNLKLLDISLDEYYFDSLITDKFVAAIIKNLKYLRHLNLKGNALISDYGMSGLDPVSGIQNGYEISQLKGLRTLNLIGCNRVSSFSLDNYFKFLELRKLSLGRNFNIKIKSIRILEKNCPSLEKLKFNGMLKHSAIAKRLNRFKKHLIQNKFYIDMSGIDYR